MTQLVTSGIMSIDEAARAAIRPSAPRPQPQRRAGSATVGFVYFIKFGDRIKIGFSRNWQRRVNELPHDEVLGVMHGGISQEQNLHALFSRYRITGEWFEDCEKIRDYIAANCSEDIAA